MTFISYAQNYEDVMLWRALRHIEKGFYVDVGANDPFISSVTQAFYERAWRGINIEPMQVYFDLLNNARPLDINMPVAVADTERDLIFYEIPETGLSTIDEEVAQKQRLAGWTVIEKKVRALTLNQIFEKHVNGPIHFLKIDVEGAEESVLQGLNLSRWRPWILVIEATVPLSQELNFASWEPLITTAKYEMVYFDGLNRFYVACEHAELIELLKTPPNFFDDFISFSQKNVLTERDIIQSKLNEVEADLEKICIERDGAHNDLRRVRSDLDRSRTERDRLSLELNEQQVKHNILLDQLTNTENKLEGAKVVLAQLQKQLDEATADRERIQKHLDDVFSDQRQILIELDQAQAELHKVYSSRSYKITAPMRAVFGTARIIRDHFIKPENPPEAKTTPNLIERVKGFIRTELFLFRKNPVVAVLLNRLKNRSPKLWNKVSRWVKDTIRDEHEIFITAQSDPTDLSLSIDEKHYFELFERELMQRKLKNPEVKS